MSEAVIEYISGPLLRARASRPFGLYESVAIGEERLLGEVVRLHGDMITVQVYEDTTGLAPGRELSGSGQPLSIPLGPGVLSGMFDGLLRPLDGFETPFIPRGGFRERDKAYRFTPQVAVGDHLAPGSLLGVAEAAGAMRQSILVPPQLGGEVIEVAEAGEYLESSVICRLRAGDGTEHAISGIQYWPVRLARPLAQRLPVDEPLITGQRVLDSLFPIGLGGKAAVPGGFGTGKTVLLETLARWCNADVIIYVGCGERGNELTGMLEEFPQLVDPRTGRSLMERTVIIANTSNMPVAAREASIYTAVTLAEYYRDQGLHVALMADSTSRWAEALREISGRLGELPGESGYPAYLSSRLAEFYERAAKGVALSGKTGSVTIMGTVSPPAGDFSEPVTSHTKRYVRSFWALDARRAQARMYPAINPLQSYAEDIPRLASWWQAKGNSEWTRLRREALELLEEQTRLERMARIIGKDALPFGQQMRLVSAELLNDAFLRQSAYSENDRYASPERQTLMLRLLMRFAELAQGAVGRGVTPAEIIGEPIYRRLQRMGEDLPPDDLAAYRALADDMERLFQHWQQGEEA